MRVGRMQVGVKSFRREFVGVVDADGKAKVFASMAAALRDTKAAGLDALVVADDEGQVVGVLFFCAAEAAQALLEDSSGWRFSGSA